MHRLLSKISRMVLTVILSAGLFCPSVFAQDHRGGRDAQRQGQGQGHGNRHYYHNGHWNRNGWYGWGAPTPIFPAGYLVTSLPPGYTTVNIGGNTYFYGNGMYFRQMPAGNFTVVILG